jgi:hypothetical protein
MFHQVFEQGELTTSIVITFQVMALTRMSPRNPNTIGPFPQSSQKEFRTHPAGAGNSYHSNIGRILHATDPGQIRRTVTAPIAEKTDNFRFPLRHVHISLKFYNIQKRQKE